MCKCLALIKKFREGNRVVIESDCRRTLLLRRTEEVEPIGKIELKDKNEYLLMDVLAVCAGIWLVCRTVRAIGRLFR